MIELSLRGRRLILKASICGRSGLNSTCPAYERNALYQPRGYETDRMNSGCDLAGVCSLAHWVYASRAYGEICINL